MTCPHCEGIGYFSAPAIDGGPVRCTECMGSGASTRREGDAPTVSLASVAQAVATCVDDDFTPTAATILMFVRFIRKNAKPADGLREVFRFGALTVMASPNVPRGLCLPMGGGSYAVNAEEYEEARRG